MDWITSALADAGGSASIVFVAKHIWEHHAQDLEKSDNTIFYTWQYDMRWAALQLRRSGVLAPAKETRRGEWMLAANQRK